MIKIVEGEYIKTLTDGNLEDLVKELDRGYILVMLKENNKLHEGYIFVEDGEIIGYYYTDNLMEEVFGTEGKVKVLELLNKENKVIEIYKYNKDKLNLMKWLCPEIFVKKDDKNKKEKSDHKEEKYIQTKITIPLGNFIAANVRDFEKYLEENKYILIYVYRKVNNNFETGYVIYYGNKPLAAAYESKNGVLFGKEACYKIGSLLNDENSVIEVYEYDEKKVNVLLEEYPNMKIDNELKEDVIEEKTDNVESISLSYEENVDISREELLKKLGISEPDDSWIEAVIEDLIKPNNEELQELKEIIEKEMIEKIKNIDGVEDIKPEINLKWENGRYLIYGDINVKRKKILGIIKKNVDPSLIKFEIDNVIKKHLAKYTSRISINIE
ncbi:conserved protein of unknown function [Methanocaldococcus lauensis]|uniref:Uncharacterized protein n=1 Tax=Methanocaldococcus lauensis TaxID=2546128 RepID=A0A8D6SYF4_9EURY|nr:DUF2226 domain-containing protein [Methanocaldococcus lauensis]CAB3289605.1 conserved protein of unknown function [Methanocaldococcus lauensis]